MVNASTIISVTASKRCTYLLALAGLFAAACATDEIVPPQEPRCSGEIATRSYPEAVDTTFPAGPLVSATTTQTTTIIWETAEPCDGEVHFAPAGEALATVVASTAVGLIHKARLVGLKAGTRYDYKVVACDLETSVLSFHAAPADTSPVRFTVWGDSQSHPEISTPVVAAMKLRGPSFTVHVGDAVGEGTIYQEWQDQYLAPVRQLGHYVPTFAAIGNHEENSHYYYDYSDYPHPEHLSDHQLFGSNYAFTFGTVFFLIVDTNQPEFLFALIDTTDLSAWIEEQLASEQAQKATWRFVAGHHGGYSESWGHCDNHFGGHPVVSGWLLPLMAQHGFHGYFAGHTHNYERGEVAGMLHILTGGAGGSLDQWCVDLPEVQVTEYSHHYLTLDAGCDSLLLRAYDYDPIDGSSELFDEVEIPAARPSP